MPLPSPISRVEQVMSLIEERIARRDLSAGARVPSLRRLAEELAISKSTVVEAYDRLVARGTLDSRPGSGFTVAARTQPLVLAPTPSRHREVDPFWIMRQSLEPGGPALKPGCGWLPDGWLPVEAMRRALRTLARDHGDDTASGLVGYGEPLGYRPLRDHIARRLAEHRIPADPGQILLTNGATTALDLVCRFFLKPGDTALVDDPCYYNFHSILAANGIRALGVPLTRDGVDTAAFERLAESERPRLYLTNATLNNPTGLSVSGPVLHQVLKLVERHDMVLVEDDVFADFDPAAPRYAAFDGLSRVVHLGGFSKTLSAASRIGFVAARRDWIEGMTDLKLATTFGANEIAARLVHLMLTDGTYRRQLDGLVRKLAEAMTLTVKRAAAIGLTPWVRPKAGSFLWLELPEGLSSEAVARHALAAGVVLAPGNLFSVGGRCDRFLRFNAAQSVAPRIWEVVAGALKAAKGPP